MPSWDINSDSPASNWRIATCLSGRFPCGPADRSHSFQTPGVLQRWSRRNCATRSGRFPSPSSTKGFATIGPTDHPEAHTVLSISFKHRKNCDIETCSRRSRRIFEFSSPSGKKKEIATRLPAPSRYRLNKFPSPSSTRGFATNSRSHSHHISRIVSIPFKH
jgi:hypothetical protein